MKTLFFRFNTSVLFVSLLFLINCTDHIDKSDLYTFRGETIASYINKEQNLSYYYELLKVVKQSSMTESTVASLLSSRGNYTCFAPVNSAVCFYLDSIYDEIHLDSISFFSFLDSVKQNVFVYDSLAKAIVYNSIIDCGAEKAYETPVFPSNNGTFVLPNMRDRYLTASNATVSGEKISYFVNGKKILKEDCIVENGCVHRMEGVIAPSDATVADLVDNMQNMKIFSELLEVTGWRDSLSLYIDEGYETLFSGLNTSNIQMGLLRPSVIPEHRKYGFTIFAETDDVFEDLFKINQITGTSNVEKLFIYLKSKYKSHETFQNLNWSLDPKDLKSPMNVINSFVSYHILPVRLPSNQLVIHYNEIGFDLESALNGQTQLGIPVYEYYETLTGKGTRRRLLKITESKQSKGIRLNRYVKIDERTGDESVSSTTDGAIDGVLVQSDIDNGGALNGFVYPIKSLLVYSDEVVHKVLNERLRFDVAALIPELINLGYRRPMGAYAVGMYNIYFPPEFYLQNMEGHQGSNIFYLGGFRYGWGDYQGDEFNISGNYDVTIKLPPVPYEGTYELRLGYQAYVARGMAQIYFGEKGFGKVPLPEGIPLDLRKEGDVYGWEQESFDDDYNKEINKRMRNNNHMRAPRSFMDVNRGNIPAYNAPWDLRRIIVKKNMDPDKTYYVRFKSVLDDPRTELHLDYLELVPSFIYNNPIVPEDEW